MTTVYSMPSDQAYRTVLEVLEAGQRWFSFDVPLDQARKGGAQRFGMTLWNFHTRTGGRDFESWAFTRETDSGKFWYRVAKERDGKTSNNRTSLWNALELTVKLPEPVLMRGVLKDGKTHRCAPRFVFGISNVFMEADGSALWLELDVPGEDIGAGFNEGPLPPLTSIEGGEKSPGSHRAGVISEAHYGIVRDAAVRVFFENALRQEEAKALTADLGINTNTVSVLFNNFRCLIEGKEFKAPMRAIGLRMFIDAIVARRGGSVLPNVIAAVEGYVNYADRMWGRTSADMREILQTSKGDLFQDELLKPIAASVEHVPAHDSSKREWGPSEILCEIWRRGPQHAAFRRGLLRRWSDKCSVHGVTCNAQLRASHIVPWSQDEAIRGDVNNGLLLSVPLDSLFDRGLISFDDEGALLRSSNLSIETMEHFGIWPNLRIRWDHLPDHQVQAIRVNLARHRMLHASARFLDHQELRRSDSPDRMP